VQRSEIYKWLNVPERRGVAVSVLQEAQQAAGNEEGAR
jgi:hypothetical protein